MADSLLTPTIIAREALMQLENNLVMGGIVHRDYKNEFVKIGDSVTVRRPVRFTTTDGATVTNQDVVEGSTTITIDKRKHVSWDFSTQDLTLTIEEYSERYIKPASISLANQIDSDVLALYKDVWNWVGTPGQTINSFADFAKGPERLDEGAVPMDQRRCVMGPADHWGLAGSQTGLFFDRIGEAAYRQGSIGTIGRVDTYMDQNVQRHTVGTGTGTPVTDGVQQTDYDTTKATGQMSLVTDGWTAGVNLLQGDVFTIDTVFAVNPVSKATLDYLQPFVLKADVTTNATTTADTTLTISPPIITTGAYKTVSVSAPTNATITYFGTAATAYPQNMTFHKNAFALVTVPLQMPDGISFRARESKNGYSIRVIKDYDFTNDLEKIRLDVLYGTDAIYPDLATRISGTA